MVHAKSAVPAPLLAMWLNDPLTMLGEADFWVSAGLLRHWAWSLRYAIEFEENHIYWGSRIEHDQFQGIFEEARGVRTSSAKLFEGVLLMRKTPNVVIFYVANVGVIGAGLVVECEFDFLNLFWPEEREKNDALFPFRYKMRIIWLNEPVRKGLWRGDKELTELLKSYSRSGLQHVADEEVVRKLRNLLKARVSSTVPAAPLLPLPPRTNWLDELSADELDNRLREKGLVFSRSVLNKLVAALKSGKHVILVGPPGTGKTALARSLAEIYGIPLVERTATSEWGRTDVVGGPVFVGGEVMWKSGALLEAIARCYVKGQTGALLLIDEINRANLDRAFGEFFTIFGSSDPKEWRVPLSLVEEIRSFQEKGKIDEWGQVLIGQYWMRGELKVPESFRVIATMNVYDRRYLFILGLALLRRFAVIEVNNPDRSELLKVLEKISDKVSIAELVVDLYEAIKGRAGLELGIAVLIDVAKVASELENQGIERKAALDNAVAMVVIPQLEGLPLNTLQGFREILKELEFQASLEAFNSFFGYELGELSK